VDVPLAFDGTNERWDTGHSQEGDEWFMVVFGESLNLSGITLTTTGSDYAAMLTIDVSYDGENFESLPYPDGGVFMEPGASPHVIDLSHASPIHGIRLNQVGTTETSWWSIREFTVQGCSPAETPDAG
jgi:hypothetical protein